MKRFVKFIMACTLLFSVAACSSKEEKEIKEFSNDAITFYVTRHGETQYNVEGLAQGWCDSPLTEKGIAQAKALGQGLKDVEFALAYSSTSKRALDTAGYILDGKNIEIKQDERLKEMNFGSLERKPSELLWHKDGVAGPAWDYYYENGWVEFGGEDFYQLGKRMKDSLHDIVKDSSLKGKNVMISTHGMSIIGLMYEIDPVKADTIGEIENCSITKIVYDNGKFTCTELNNTDYIK